MPGFCCSSWEAAGGNFFTQHAVKPCNSFLQATADNDSVPVFSCACAGNCHQGLLTLQIAAKQVCKLWAAGVLGSLEERLTGLTGRPWAGWDSCRCPH